MLFKLHKEYEPTGDQPQAIEALVKGFQEGNQFQTLLGVTGSGTPNKTKVAKITKDQVRAIAEQKLPDLNAGSVEAAMSMIAGTARSMGVTVVD